MTFRFKFTPDFDDKLVAFSEPFKNNSDRKEFKSAFEVWAEENKDNITRETERLKELKYEGDILNKIFVSARYYYRKRVSNKGPAKKRRSYKAVGSSLIQSIDSHLALQLRNEGAKKYKPSVGFSFFILENSEMVEEECNRNGITDPVDKEKRIKKAFKNRCYLQLNQKSRLKKI